MPKITVITPTVRPEGLLLVAKALRRQTLKDYEWLVTSPWLLNFIGEGINAVDAGTDFATYYIDPPREDGDYWAVYKAYNQAISKSQGELIVSWQDFTFAKPDSLQKFWDHYQADNKKIVSGVGNKYSDDTWSVMTWKDPRERDDQGSFYPCNYNDIEFNFCAIPKAAFYEVGGFDEYFDTYSSLCGLDVLARLNIVGGWDFHLDQTNKSFSLEHGRLPDWEERLPFNGPWQERFKEYLANPKLTYLI